VTTVRNTGYKDLGPDTSKVPSSLSGPKYSFGTRFDGIPFDHPALSARRKLVERDQCQPQSYCPESTIGKAPGIKINPPHSTRAIPPEKITRGTDRSQDSPIMMKDKIPGPVMVRPQEKIQNPIDIAPGPGAYNVIEAYKYAHPGLIKSIGGVASDSKQGNVRGVPGPGAYDPKLMQRIPGPKIMAQSARRIQSIEKKSLLKDTGDSITKVPMKTERATFGKSERGDLCPKTITPGPDAYQQIDTDWRGKKVDPDKEICKFGMKTSKFYQTNNYPSPGHYKINYVPYGGPGFSMGTGARTGPVAPKYTDQYYYPKDLYPGPAVSFTIEPRSYECKKSKYPGPGMYDIADTVGIIPDYLLNGRVSE